MVDFHSHILPNVDDGSGSISESLSMLRQSFLQGVDKIVCTSHFYADEEYPKSFLNRRNDAFQKLNDAIFMSPEVYPEIILGAEVLYFPGISEAEEVAELKIGSSACILIEPPMLPWSDAMLNEIYQLGKNFECKPVIAHVDRYMGYLKDENLIKRVLERDMLVQVNGDYFLNPKTVNTAIRHLKNDDIHLIGSDCHDLYNRAPNLGLVRKIVKTHGAMENFEKLHRNAADLLRRGR